MDQLWIVPSSTSEPLESPAIDAVVFSFADSSAEINPRTVLYLQMPWSHDPSSQEILPE